MDATFRRWLDETNEGAIDDAFYDNACPHCFAVDWGEADEDIVQYCAESLGVDTLRAEWRDEALVIAHHDNETTVPLSFDENDRDTTIRTLNDVLQPDFEIRLLVASCGNDTAGFVVLSAADWQTLDTEVAQAVNENFVKLSLLPNIFTEMTDQHLPDAARARFNRMVERNRNR